MIVAILAAEAAFWVFLLGGLGLRYLAGTRRAGSAVLAVVPLADLALVALVGIDVVRGAEPTRAHAFAVVYLGVTVAFGRPLVRGVDAWFRYRFAGGPRPSKPAKGSTAEVRALWHEWFRLVAAAATAAAGLLVLIALEGRPLPPTIEAAATHPCWAVLLLLAIVTAVWFLAGPAFAGRGDPALDEPRDERSTGDLPMCRVPPG
ncbi:hypothetical protein [Saccharopolyspora sp. CA-218241]|uniref:hypothetical protein n=1 Tax=Saccharopolyspora sp. CA-218241 TaxID=3240027 RepID=UPI003D97CBD7